MAFLLRFAPADTPQWQGEGLYLDQVFYTQLHELCERRPHVFPNLQRLAHLGYDAEVLFTREQLSALQAELGTALPLHRHSQLAAFRSLVAEALKRGDSLAVTGDMYPVLG